MTNTVTVCRKPKRFLFVINFRCIARPFNVELSQGFLSSWQSRTCCSSRCHRAWRSRTTDLERVASLSTTLRSTTGAWRAASTSPSPSGCTASCSSSSLVSFSPYSPLVLCGQCTRWANDFYNMMFLADLSCFITNNEKKHINFFVRLLWVKTLNTQSVIWTLRWLTTSLPLQWNVAKIPILPSPVSLVIVTMLGS